MKTSTLACMAGVAVPLILSGSASGGFTGIEVVEKNGAEQYGLTTINIYAIFDRPGEDLMLSVFGTPPQHLIIEAVGGTFFNHSFGGLKAPQQSFVNFVPSLAYDTFVTIGVKTFGLDPQGGGINAPDLLVLSPFFPVEIGPGPFILTNWSWSVTPVNPQANPFDPNYAAGDGHVLIGQFSSADTDTFQGTMGLFYISNGVNTISTVSFFHVPAPGALGVLGVAGLLGSGRRRRITLRAASRS